MELVVEESELGAYGEGLSQYEVSTEAGKFLGYLVKLNDKPHWEYSIGINPDLHLTTAELRAIADKMDELNPSMSFWRRQLNRVLGR